MHIFGCENRKTASSNSNLTLMLSSSAHSLGSCLFAHFDAFFSISIVFLPSLPLSFPLLPSPSSIHIPLALLLLLQLFSFILLIPFICHAALPLHSSSTSSGSISMFSFKHNNSACHQSQGHGEPALRGTSLLLQQSMGFLRKTVTNRILNNVCYST